MIEQINLERLKAIGFDIDYDHTRDKYILYHEIQDTTMKLTFDNEVMASELVVDVILIHLLDELNQ